MAKCPHCDLEHDELMHFCPATGKPIELGERMVGQTLLGRFTVTAILGGSSIGGVYRAEDTQDSSTVTLKMLHPSLGRNKDVADAYIADVEKAAALDHPNLGRIVAVDRDESGAPVVVREFLEGRTLAEVMDHHSDGMPHGRAVYLLTGLLSCLHELHAADVYNGDLTPRDIFVVGGDNGEAVVKLAEIGERHIKSALEAEEAEKPENRPFVAPEQVRDGKSEKGTDIFACGAIFYKMLTGNFPYPEGIPPRPEKIPAFEDISKLKPDVPKAFDYTVRRALALFPRDRFKTPAMFADALKNFYPPDALMYSDLVPGYQAQNAEAEHEATDDAGSPPGTVEVPFDEGEDPTTDDAGTADTEEMAAPAAAPEPAPQKTETPSTAPVPQAPAKAPEIRTGRKHKVEHSEESLAPIMPSRFAKWLIPVAIIVGIIALIALGRTIYYMATLEKEPDIMELAMGGADAKTDDDEQKDAQTASEEPVTSATEPAPDASTTPDAGQQDAATTAVDTVGAEQITIKLLVTPKDAGAVVTLDGKPAPPPWEWPLPADGASHSYKVSAKGYEAIDFKFVADKDRILEAKLQPLPEVSIELTGVPSGAKVTLDGKSVSQPYKWTFEPSKQPHSYRITATGYETFEGAFIPDKDKTVTAKLIEEKTEEPVTAPTKKPTKKKPTKKPTKKPGKKTKDTTGGFVDEVPF